jgi:cytochrome P450
VTVGRVRARRPPGPRGYPLVGVFLEARLSPLAFFLDVARRYGDVVSLQLGWQQTYLVSHPDHVKHVLQDIHHAYYKGPPAGRVRSLFGESLTTADGDRWLRQRQLMLPAFHPQRLMSAVPIIIEATATMLDRWESLARASQPLDVLREMTDVARRIIIHVVFGDVPVDDARVVGRALDVAFEHTHRRLWSMLPWVECFPTPGNLQCRVALRTLDAFVRGKVEESRRRGHPASDVLSTLLEARDQRTGERMSDAELRHEVKALLFAGHATTASALAWTWFLLSLHPWAEQRLQQEIRTVLAQRPPAAEDLPALAYARMLVDEVLRLYPPTWLTARTPLADVELGGYRIPAKAIVLLSPFVTHRHPAFWEDPETFDPERFTVERSAGRSHFAYFPFGRGPRGCIGSGLAVMEMQLIVVMVAQRYRLTLVPGSRVEPDPGIMLRPRQGVPMILHRNGR